MVTFGLYLQFRGITKFDKGLMLNVGMCAYDVLVLLAEPFAIKLNTSHPQEINCNNC